MRKYKKQKDLIKYAIKKAIYRNDVEKSRRIKQTKEKIEEKLKDKNWLAWAERKLRMPR